MKLKKVLKIIGITLVTLLVLLFVTPIIFKGKIEQLIKDNINKNLNAKLEFAETDISLIRNFPGASVKIINLNLVNYAPFLGDTLVSVKEVNLKMSLTELFNGADEPMKIDFFAIDGARVNVKVNKDGQANYDIAKASTEPETETTTEDTSSGGFSLQVKGYELTNCFVDYNDASTGMEVVIDSLNHFGSGDLSLETSEFDTKTNARVSFVMDSTKYLNNNSIALDAVLGVDLKNNKYSFLDNKLLVNKLELVFDGFVQLLDEGQQIDLTFETPSSDFKNFLALIPEAYSKNIEGVQTKGTFSVKGMVKGVMDEEHIPTFAIEMLSEDAMFKYPDLPKAVEDIYLTAHINNTTGILADTEVNLEKLNLRIDQDVFKANALVTQALSDNAIVKANLDGRMNLANLNKAYPVDLDIPLSGILDANLATAFDMQSIEKEQYQNTKNSGSIALSGFTYSSDAMAKPLTINKTALTFTNTAVNLNEFDAKSGSTDIQAKGSISNFLGYMFNDELLKGNFDITSNNFDLSDFMVAEEPATETKTEEKTTPESSEPTSIKIPDFLDATVTVNVKKVKYDNLTLTNTKGKLVIRDETATLDGVSANLLGGTISVDGSASTKGSTPTFDMGLGINSFTIGEAFEELQLLKSLAPIAKAIEGTLNSTIKLKGNLDESLSPDLTTISGNAIAEILGGNINKESSKLLSSLDSNVNFIDLSKLNLKDLKTVLTFENGKVNIKPFQIKYKDINIDVEGSHGFDQIMSYNATFNVPAKYLGSDVSKLLSQLNDSSMDNTIIPVTANIGGTFTDPKITTDVSKAVTDLTNQIIQKQKDKLINTGKDKVKDAVTNLISGNSSTKDSTNTEDKKDTKTTVKDAIKGIFGKKKN